MAQIDDATMSLRAIIKNLAWEVIDSQQITSFGEPYHPIVGDKVLPTHPYEALKSGWVKPNLKMAIEYAHHEGEMFIASVIHPFDEPVLESRNSGFPLKLWEYAIYRNFGMVDGQRVLDMFGCREKCDGSRTCDCEYEFERWLTSWLWTCHFRSGSTNTVRPL